jgi:hypothetical protein
LEQALEIVDSLRPRPDECDLVYPLPDKCEIYYPDVPDGWTLNEETTGWQMDGPDHEMIRCSQSNLPVSKMKIDAGYDISVDKILLKNNVLAYHVQGDGALCQLIWKDDDNRVYYLTYNKRTTLELVLEIIDTLGPRS